MYYYHLLQFLHQDYKMGGLLDCKKKECYYNIPNSNFASSLIISLSQGGSNVIST